MTSDHGRFVLVVDDDPLVRRALRLMIELEGWDVTEADSGPAALQALEEHDFEIVITDLTLPGMSGEEFARAVRERRSPALTVVAVSRRRPRKGTEALFDAVLEKAVRPSDLRKWLPN